MKKNFFLKLSLIIFIIVSCSSSDDNSSSDNTISLPRYIKGCKNNDNDYENYSGEYSYLNCFYKEENGIVKMSLYDGGYGNIGNLIDNYTINLNTSTRTYDSPYLKRFISNNIIFEFYFNYSTLDQNENGYYDRVTVKVENHIMHFKPSSCSSYIID